MESSEAEICSNCGRELRRSEQACVFKGEIVCAECDRKLRSDSGLQSTSLPEAGLFSPSSLPVFKGDENITDEDINEILGLDDIEVPATVDISKSAETKGAVTKSNSDATQGEARYKSVWGWLLVLCLILTVISPVGNVVLLFLKSIQARSLLERFPDLRALLISESILAVGLTAFSIYAGIGLWMVRPNAVKIAKSYFIVLFSSQLLFYAFLARIMLVAAGIPADVAVEVEFVSPLYKLGLLASCWIWISYLKRSKRVKATYPKF